MERFLFILAGMLLSGCSGGLCSLAGDSCTIVDAGGLLAVKDATKLSFGRFPPKR